MNPTPRIIAGLCDSTYMRQIAACAETPYLLLSLDTDTTIDITPQEFDRLASVMSDTDSAIVYSDYRMTTDGDTKIMRCIDYREGSVRDDFNFGPIVLINTDLLKQSVDSLPDDYDYAAWYHTRLHLSRMGAVTHIPEPLYTATPHTETIEEGERHFSYVNPRNRAVQIEMERACTGHLKAIDAFLKPDFEDPDYGDDFPVEASIIIPVRNREATIGDAVFSALDQLTDFPFNVIVVDNHSTDGTTSILRRLSDDPRLIHIIPDSTDLWIGGCWNLALAHNQCGRFAVQLDSDDIYSSSSTLQTIVDHFRRQPCAMVIGSYSLTDINLQPIPPGIIDHREWTDTNGRNNALRINGLGAPRAFATAIARQMPMPNVSYGEDYAMGLRISRTYRIGRIYDVLYLCRRWGGNSDSSLSMERANEYNAYKDTLRTWEILARQSMNRSNG